MPATTKRTRGNVGELGNELAKRHLLTKIKQLYYRMYDFNSSKDKWRIVSPMTDINEKPNNAVKFDGMSAYIYELSDKWEVHVRIWEDEPEPEGKRIDNMIDYLQHEGFFDSNSNQIQVWVVGLKR